MISIFFLKVNDTYGHLAGDSILQQLGALIRETFRNTCIPARYGGEEFAIILPETSQADAAALAEQFRQDVAAHAFSVEKQILSITVSIGFATHDCAVSSPITTEAQLIEG